MAQTKPKAAQFYGVSGHGTAGQVLISDGNGGMSWGANTEEFTVSWATPTGQGLTYTQPSPQSSVGIPGSAFPTTTFTATKSGEEISGTATIAGLPTGITASQSLSGTGADNVLTVTLTGAFPGVDSLNTALTISGLTVVPPLVVDYLVIAGGGGGGAGYYSGGGGAGGYRTSYGDATVSALSLNAATNYTVTIGAGGAAQSSQSTVGNSGNDSVFATITSAAGGGGGSRDEGGGGGPRAGLAGGSGGGTAYGYAGGAGNTPSVTPSQGNAGGQASSGNTYGSGGGGASAAGGGTNSDNNGGAGTANSITGSSVTYAGGGGGGGYEPHYNTGTGGVGGGGNGGDRGTGAASTAGTANTGGGGGGGGGPSGNANNGAAGGSGIVILRYPSGYTISGLSGTTTTVGTDKVTTFTNAGTGNIQFN